VEACCVFLVLEEDGGKKARIELEDGAVEDDEDVQREKASAHSYRR